MNFERIEQIVALTQEYPISEITVEETGRKIHVKRPYAAPQTATMPVSELTTVMESQTAPRAQDSAITSTVFLTAPMVGIFHHTKQQLYHGAAVTAGQIVGNIESMKLMNEVTAQFEGQVIEVLIEEGTPVEYGQALFRLATP
jgi:biotin carboxyl carrier protein